MSSRAMIPINWRKLARLTTGRTFNPCFPSSERYAKAVVDERGELFGGVLFGLRNLAEISRDRMPGRLRPAAFQPRCFGSFPAAGRRRQARRLTPTFHLMQNGGDLHVRRYDHRRRTHGLANRNPTLLGARMRSGQMHSVPGVPSAS